jgi:hypothetical protein
MGRVSVPGEASFLSRFTIKFLEVLAAGVATAFSGYLVAHLTGYSPAPAPGAVQSPAVQEQPPSNLNALAPAQTVVNAAPAAALRKSIPGDNKPGDTKSADIKPADNDAIANKLRDTADSEPRDAVESKPGAAQSLEARVRAALANANRPAPAEAPRRQAETPSNAAPRPIVIAPAVANEPRVADAPTDAIAAPPAPQTAAVPLALPATVEIRSQPVAGADAPPPPQADAQAAEKTQDKAEDNNPFSAFAKLLRSDKPLPDDQAPRPPAPVGQ